MELFVCALHVEATPLIGKLRLKKNLGSREFELFENDHAALIVSGIGPLRSAMATTFLLQYVTRSAPDRRPYVITNFGIAGSTTSIPLSTVCKVKKIYDLASGETFFPDLSLKSSLPLATLHTAYRPVSIERESCAFPAEETDRLYDMEGSGFFLAGSRFLSVEALQVIKIVSDHLDPKGLRKELIQGLAESLLPDLMRESQNLKEAHRAFYTSPLTKQDQQLMEQITEALKLTESERHQLRSAALRYKVLQAEALQTNLLGQIPHEKRGKKLLFQQILREWEEKS